jgi:hypothetical protein
MIDQGGRRLSSREDAALPRILAATDETRPLVDALTQVRVAARASCCPTVAFVTESPTRAQPHGTLVERLVAEAGCDGRHDVEVLVFTRDGQLSSMEYVHYHPVADVAGFEFPPADELRPRPGQ